MRWRLRLVLLSSLTVLLLGGAAVAGWLQMTSDLEREGREVGFIGCIVAPGPAFDWSHPLLRRFAWSALTAPEWTVHGDVQEMREGAGVVLRRSVRAADEEAAIAHGLAGALPARSAGVHLGLAWVARGERIPTRARTMLAAGGAERALALFALPVVSGRRFEALDVEYDASWTVRAPDLDARLAATFGMAPDELAAEWTVWLAEQGSRPIAELQAEWLLADLARWPIGASLREPGGARLAAALLREPDGDAWRAALGLSRRESRSDEWLSSRQEREQLASHLRAADPPPIPAALVGREVRFSISVWSW